MPGRAVLAVGCLPIARAPANPAKPLRSRSSVMRPIQCACPQATRSFVQGCTRAMTPHPVGRDAQVIDPSMHSADDEHGVWTASDGGAQFVDNREVVVSRAGGTHDDGERPVGGPVRGGQRAVAWSASPRSEPAGVIVNPFGLSYWYPLVHNMFRRPPVCPVYGNSAISRAFLIAVLICRCCWTVRPVT